MNSSESGWDEGDSEVFIDLGDSFVPEREFLNGAIASLIPHQTKSTTVVELCCGDGHLAEVILGHHLDVHVVAYDRSRVMLVNAATRLAGYRERFRTVEFDLESREWRSFDPPVRAVVSTLAFHHLEDVAKRELYLDLYEVIEEGGRLIIADIILPSSNTGMKIAADRWDMHVKNRSRARASSTEAYEMFQKLEWNYFLHPEADPSDKPAPLVAQLKWIAEAGFTEVDVHWLDAGHALISAAKHEYEGTTS